MPGKALPSRPPHPHQVSMVSFLAPFPGSSSSLKPYLIVDRPVPGFGCELIVLGFEAIVPLQENGRKEVGQGREI